MQRIAKMPISLSLSGSFSLLLGMVVIVGWHTNSPLLIQVLPGFVPMQYNTALGFVLCGVGLVAMGREKIAVGAGLLAALIGCLTLCEYGFGVDLGIDELFMRHTITVKTSHPGRMAPNTAMCFALVGSATAWLAMSTDRRGAGLLGTFALALGVVALSGYLIGVETAYGWGHLTRMAVHTAVGFIALAVGIVCFVWDRVYGPDSGWRETWFGGAIALLTLLLWQALAAREEVIGQIAKSDGAALNQARSILPEVVLATGLIAALMLVLMLRLQRRERLHLRELVTVNRSLEQEIGERSRIEGELQLLNANLEEAVQERTRESAQRAEELAMKIEELQRFNRLVVGRELRNVELKKQINALCAELGRDMIYAAEDVK